ncbi:MAG TPA: TonB-dependent receptor [Candidatus Acidoferrales bacterium]|nr:TonB-dependent receptor [Candidatus Acidoferrales bacterium]
MFSRIVVLCLIVASIATLPANSRAAEPAPDADQSKQPAAAATQSSTPPTATVPAAPKLKQVVVTATRIEQPIAEIGTTVTVVDDSQIESQKIDRVENVLREVPGVTVTQSGSPGAETDVSIRGATASQTLILIDGVEANSGATGSFDMANLTTDNLDRLEVLRGAGGSLYGSQAIGGVVSVISQEGEGAPHASLESEGGNSATSRQVATASGRTGSLAYSGAVSYFSTEGFHQTNGNSDNLATSGRLDYHLCDDTVIRGFARYIASNVSLPSFSVFAGLGPASLLNPTAHGRNEFMLYKGEVEHRFGEKLMLTASAFFVRQDQRVNSTPYAGNAGSEVDRIPDETRGGLIEALYTWTAGFRTLAGFDFKDRWVSSSTASSSPSFGTFTSAFHARRQEYAGYVEQEGSFFEGRVLVTGGFRVDGNSQFGEEVSPAWSVAIPIAKISTTLRGSYSEGFRAPSFDELFFPGFGNPSLQPEVSSEYDGGFTTNFGARASFTATYFSRRVKNLIVTVPCPFGPGCQFGSQAGNAGRVDTQGVEIVPSVTPLTGLTMSGYVTILDETHTDVAGSTARPLRVPKYSASSLVQYVRGGNFLPHDRITASMNYIFVGDRDDITVSSTIQNHKAYNRVDAVLSYATGARLRFIRNEEVFGRVSNLMDRGYSEAFGFRAPPINFLAGVKLDFE